MAVASVLPTPPSSPSHPSRTPVVVHIASTSAVAESTPPRTIAVLKTDLRIIDSRCGAQTPGDTECQRRILKGNKQLINLQLTSMTGLTRASPDFEPALLKLVMLVHCYQHNAGQPKEYRLETWKLVFPPGSADGSEPEAPLEQRIRKALGPLSVECIARSNGCTCKIRVGGQKVQNCERTLQELAKQDAYSDEAKLELLLKVLEWNRTCSNHQSLRQFTWVEAWKKSLTAVLPLPKPVVEQAIANNAPNEPQTPPRARASPPVITTSPMTENETLVIVQIHTLSKPQASLGPTTNLETDPASYWPKAYDTSPFDIHAHAKDLSPIILHTSIRSVISRPLNAQDILDGYVYAYEVEGNSGYVKIGYTTRSVTDRHDEWSFECNRQTKSLYPAPAPAANISSGVAATTPAATAVLVPHARRIEALCHAELKHHHIKMYCGACLKQHIEWFDVSAVEVTAVIQKWSRWMATRPYELLQLRSRPKWVLKACEVQRTLRIEQLMRELAVVPTSLGRED